jgi:predicted HicB family RNase H-like nuclease
MPKKTKSLKSRGTETSALDAAEQPAKMTTRPGKKIISIAVDEKLASRLSLLARAEGVSVTQLITEAVSKNLKARIAAALDSLRADLEA